MCAQFRIDRRNFLRTSAAAGAATMLLRPGWAFSKSPHTTQIVAAAGGCPEACCGKDGAPDPRATARSCAPNRTICQLSIAPNESPA